MLLTIRDKGGTLQKRNTKRDKYVTYKIQKERSENMSQIINMRKLKAAMAINGEKQYDLAKAIGLTVTQLSSRMRGKVEFSHHTIYEIVKHYDLTPDEIAEIFFDIKRT